MPLGANRRVRKRLTSHRPFPTRRVFASHGGGHRYFAHLSYKTTKWFELAMAMTIQISASNENIVYWINFHDYHHQACETEDVSLRHPGRGSLTAPAALRAFDYCLL